MQQEASNVCFLSSFSVSNSLPSCSSFLSKQVESLPTKRKLRGAYKQQQVSKAISAQYTNTHTHTYKNIPTYYTHITQHTRMNEKRRGKNWYDPGINLSLNGLCDNTPCVCVCVWNNSSILSGAVSIVLLLLVCSLFPTNGYLVLILTTYGQSS